MIRNVRWMNWVGDSGLFLSVVISSWTNCAMAGDDQKDLIVVDDAREYDTLIEELYRDSPTTEWPNWPNEFAPPQVWEGVTGIFAPNKWSSLDQYGTIVANKEGLVWTEDWFLYRPETLMNGVYQSWPAERTNTNTVNEVMDQYEMLPDADSYRHMQVRFTYRDPITSHGIALMPDVLSVYVDKVFRYRVFTVTAGVAVEAGALHRQRWVQSDVIWKDTWVLWNNFTVESEPLPAGPSYEIILEPISSGNQTPKSFLYEQQQRPQKWHVTTTGSFTPLSSP